MATGSARAGWERVVGEFERSGQSVREYATARGINPHTLSWWRWRLRTEPSRPPTTRFMRVVLEGPQGPRDPMAERAPTVEAALPNGVVLRFTGLDREGLRGLAATLMAL